MSSNKITWISSYPRSGNTWMRALITAYANNAVIDINCIIQNNDKTPEYYNDIIKKPIHDWTMFEQALIKPVAMLRMLEESGKNLILKTHDCNVDISGVAQIPTDFTRSAIYMVRDPRDVVLSLKNHYGCSDNAEAVDILINDSSITRFSNKGLFVPQLSWKINVTSWMRKLPYPVHIVKYEDMLERPVETFSEVVKFIGVKYEEQLIIKTIDACSFDKFQKQELKNGFRESIGPKFFHKGITKRWKKELESELQTKIVNACEIEMKSLGYI